MSKIEETYNTVPSIIKEHAGLPDSYRDLTNDQERFIMEMFHYDFGLLKKDILETLDEVKGLVNEL